MYKPEKVLQSGTIRVIFLWKKRDMLQNCNFCHKLIKRMQRMLYFQMPTLYSITLCESCATEGGFPWIEGKRRRSAKRETSEK